MQTLAMDSFCSLTNPQPYQRDGAQPPLTEPSFAGNFSVEVSMCKLDNGYDIRTVQELLGHSRREIRRAHVSLRLRSTIRSRRQVLRRLHEGFAGTRGSA